MTAGQDIDQVYADLAAAILRRRDSGAGIASQHIAQPDGYLAAALATGRGVRNGVLTDGRRWLLRHTGAGEGAGADAAAGSPVWTLESAASKL